MNLPRRTTNDRPADVREEEKGRTTETNSPEEKTEAEELRTEYPGVYVREGGRERERDLNYDEVTDYRPELGPDHGELDEGVIGRQTHAFPDSRRLLPPRLLEEPADAGNGGA